MKILVTFDGLLFLQFKSTLYCAAISTTSLTYLGGDRASKGTFNKVDQWIPPELLLTEETIQAIEEESINA